MLSEISQEITFKIDYDQAALFQNFFADFDERMGELDILSYGISMTTLEEVFLKANGDHDDSGIPKVESQQNEDDERFLLKGNRENRGSSINRNENDPENRAVDKDQFGDGSLHQLEN